MENYSMRKRFCKDNKLSIKLYESPFFEDRLNLFHMYNKWKKFEDYVYTIWNTEQDYFRYYNQTKDDIIDYIKNSEAYQMLNTINLKQFDKLDGFAHTDVYKDTNVGHKFISIDMSKANFTALVHFSKETNNKFFDSYNYEQFISQFTNCEHIIKSKYIRQVVFGNCNPKRQIMYELYLMSEFLKQLLEIIDKNDVYSLQSDEILLKADSYSLAKVDQIKKFVNDNINFPYHFEYYTLGKIIGSTAFIKKFTNGYELKCVTPEDAPFIYKLVRNEEVTPNDMIFEYNGKLAKFLEIPDYSISYKEINDV